MEHPLFFLCPSCFSENSFEKSRCPICNAEINIRKDEIICSGQRLSSADYYDLLFRKLSIRQTSKPAAEIDLENLEDVIRISRKAILRQGNSRFEFSGYHHIFKRFIETPRPVCEGHLVIRKKQIEFLSDSETFTWHVYHLTCITTNGHYFEFKAKHQPFYQIKFLKESQLKYEIILRKWLSEFYRNAGANEVIEFQPRIIFSPPDKSVDAWDSPAIRAERNYFLEKIFISIIRFTIRTALRLWIKVRIFSRENWNSTKNGFTILNHQSAFDPFIVGAFLDRKIAFLTKSSSFTHGFPRFFLRWLMGVPTTRYQTDPEVIYTIRKLLERGIRIGIFAEGERTWGGKMQPFKMSLVKLLMASREAITPIILKNAFHFWPRWAKFPRRAEVQIQVGAPFCLIPGIYSVDEQRKFLEEYFKTRLDEN